MRPRNILALTLAAQLLLPAADFWTTSAPDQWSEKDIKKMATDSPWAKEANVTRKGFAGAAPPAGVDAAPGPAIGDDPQPGARRGDATGGNVLAVPHIVVRWDSAVPVCEACAKGGMERYLFSCYSKLLYLSGMSKKFDELSKEFYILTMSNYPKLLQSGWDAPEHSAAGNAALERMGERIQQGTFLRRKGKDPIKPARVVVLPAGQELLPVVFFPRTGAITLDDKEVLFESADGTLEVRSKFTLKQMVYKGKLDL